MEVGHLTFGVFSWITLRVGTHEAIVGNLATHLGYLNAHECDRGRRGRAYVRHPHGHGHVEARWTRIGCL